MSWLQSGHHAVSSSSPVAVPVSVKAIRECASDWVCDSIDLIINYSVLYLEQAGASGFFLVPVVLSGLKFDICTSVRSALLIILFVYLFLLIFLFTWHTQNGVLINTAWCSQLNISCVFLSFCITYAFWLVKENTFAQPLIGTKIFVTGIPSWWIVAYKGSLCYVQVLCPEFYFDWGQDTSPA